MLTITIGQFVFEASLGSLFVRVPLIGQAFLGRGLSAFDAWRTLKVTGKV